MARKPATPKAQRDAAKKLRAIIAATENTTPREVAFVRRLEGATSALEASAGIDAAEAGEDA